MPNSTIEKEATFLFQDFCDQSEILDEFTVCQSQHVASIPHMNILFTQAIALYCQKMSELSRLPFHKSEEQRRIEEERNRNDEKRWLALSGRRKLERHHEIKHKNAESHRVFQEEQAKDQYRILLAAADRAQLLYHTTAH